MQSNSASVIYIVSNKNKWIENIKKKNNSEAGET